MTIVILNVVLAVLVITGILSLLGWGIRSDNRRAPGPHAPGGRALG
jgi:hypothetical protein